MSGVDQLWWSSHGAVLALLQDQDPNAEQAKKQLESHYEWILNGTSSFQQPSDASKKLLNENKTVTFKGKKFAIEPLLRPATVKLSLLLDLDELQAHILLKRWLKDTGQDKVLEGSAPGAQVGFGLDVMLQVLAYYHEERLMLLKCIQFVLLQGTNEPVYTSMCERLVKAGLEDKVFSALRGNMDTHGPASAAFPTSALSVMSSGGVSGRIAAIMREFAPAGNMAWLSAVHASLLEQRQRECAELLSLLLLLYELPSPPLGLHCSSHRVLELGSMLGGSVFPPAPPQSPEPQQPAADAAPPPNPNPAAAMAEQLGCLLLLSVLDLPAFIKLTSSAPPGPSAPLSLDELVPLGGKVWDLHNEIRGWAGTETNALLLLTWSAVVKLLEPYVDLGESWVEELQARAFQAGGFGAAARCLRQHSSLVSSAFGQLHRSILLRALCLTCTAFELGPSRLRPDIFSPLLELVEALLAGAPALCGALWDEELPLTQPLRALLADAAAVFPADVAPAARLLAAAAGSPAAAAAAYAFLQSAPRLAVLHDVADPAVQPLGPGAGVQLRQAVMWNQAPSVSTMMLPEGIEGHVVPLPAILSHVEGQRLIVWDVRGTHRSFGQLLLLGRAAHCVHVLEGALASRGAVDGTAVQDLQGAVQLLAVLCRQEPELVPDVMSLTVDLASSCAKVTWLDVTAAAASVLVQLVEAGVPNSGLPPCLQLLQQLARFHPTQVLEAIQRVHILSPAAVPPALSPQSAQPLPALPLSALPTMTPAAAYGVYQGLLPSFRTFLQGLGAQADTSPELLAFLDLLAQLLEAGHTGGPMTAYVLFVLDELLPSPQLMTFRSVEGRWAVTARALKVLRLAIEAGAHMAPPSPPPSAPASTPPPRWEQHITPLAAHLLTHLLLHGPALLAPYLPPPAADLDALRASDPTAPALAPLEATVSELLSLLPSLASAARTFPHELPLEEFLFFSPTPSGTPPAALLASYLSYSQTEAEIQEPSAADSQLQDSSISYLALKALQALQACISRPVGRSLMAGLSMALVVPRGGPTQDALRALFRPDTARALPRHFLLAVEVLEAAVTDSAELLDCMLFPSGLEEEEVAREQQQQQPKEVAGGAAAGQLATTAAPAPAPAAAAAGPSAKKGPPSFSALDGLSQLLGLASSLKDEAPEVLCYALRAVCCLWQHQSITPWPAALLRICPGPGVWSALELTLGLKAGPAGTGTGSRGRGSSPLEDSWLQLAEAYAWQILMLEVHACPRPSSSTSASPSLGPWALVDAALESGALAAAVRHCSSVMEDRRPLQKLLLVLQATYLELGACCLGGVLGEGSSGEDSLAASAALRAELQQLRASAEPQLLRALSRADSGSLGLGAPGGGAGGEPLPWDWDVKQCHALLLEELEELEEGEGRRSSPRGAGGGRLLRELLGRQPLGLGLLGRSCPVSGLTMQAVGYGRGYLLDARRLRALLGPLAGQLASAERLAQAYGEMGLACSVASARLSALQAVCGLAAVLSKDPQSFALLQAQVLSSSSTTPLDPQTPAPSTSTSPATPSTSSSVVDAAMQASSASVALLLSWYQDPSGTQLAAWPTGTLLQYLADATLCSVKLLLHSLTALKPAPAASASSALVVQGAGTPLAAAAAAATAFPYGAPRQAAVPEARTLFPVTPPRVGRPGTSTLTPLSIGGGAGGGGGAASSSAGAVALTVCLPLCTLLSTWLRAVSTGNLGLGSSPAAALAQVTNTLGSCAVIVLQAARGVLLGSPPLPELRGVQDALLSALPHLCRLAACGAMQLPVAMQLVSEAVGRLLPASDWLPVLQEQLDLTQLLLQSVGRRGAEGAEAVQQNAGDLGLLQLAILVAQTHEGARMLHEQGAMEKLAALARHLLSAQGGGLAPFNSLEFPGARARGAAGWDTSTMSTRPFLPPAPSSPGPSVDPADYVDLAYAYMPGSGAWAPSHQQWCMLLSFSSVLLRTLSQHVDVEAAAVELLVAAEPRLLLSCVPPAGGGAQPLTLASLFELERVLFLLRALLQCSGLWQAMLPGSLARFRTAAAAFVGFAALPDTAKAFSVACPPQSPAERLMAAQPSGLPRTEGWFRSCSIGAAPPSHPLLAGHCSEYSGRMAELMYSCLNHALTFLIASSPQLGESEGQLLGPMWPRARDLSALQEQCMAVLYSMADTPRVGGGVEGAGRRKHICQGVLRVLQLLADFLDVLSQPSGRRGGEAGSMREQLLAVEAALCAGEVLPRPISSSSVLLSPAG